MTAVSRQSFSARRVAVLCFGLASAGLTFAPSAEAKDPVKGASVEDLLAVVQRMSPELAAMSLEADAAAARVDAADKLPDPKLTFLYDEWPRSNPGYAPSLSRFGTMKYDINQDFPLGGKRDLKREQAAAEHRGVLSQRQSVALDLAQRVKVVYAEYHQADQAVEQLASLKGVVDRLAAFSQSRYRQGLGTELDSLQAELERKELESETVSMTLERRKAGVRLNALLNRPAATPLVEMPHLRPMPPPAKLDQAALLERALQANPQLQTQKARIDAADRGRDLADRSWYPDLGVGVGVVQKGGRLDSYQAMVEVNIPLQWELRHAQQAEATAMAGSARAQLAQAERQVEADLGEAMLGLQAALEREAILRDGLEPEANAAFQAAGKSYELGLTEFITVLEAERRLKSIHLDHLKIQLEQQMRLADLERLIGGDL